MKIRIIQVSMMQNLFILIDTDNNIIRCNKVEIEKNASVYAFSMKEIARDWPESLKDLSATDSTNIRITFIENDQKQEYSFNGKFPDNFKSFNTLIKEISDAYNKKSSIRKNI